MYITEKDLFDYIFYPAKLSREKFKEIYSKRALFESQIKMMRVESRKMDEGISKEEEDSIFNEIIRKAIPTNITLKKINGTAFGKNDIRLTAETKKLTEKLESNTFADTHSQYLVKVIASNEYTKIYVFDADNTTLEKFKINLNGGEFIFDCEAKDNPIIINGRHRITSIELSVN